MTTEQTNEAEPATVAGLTDNTMRSNEFEAGTEYSTASDPSVGGTSSALANDGGDRLSEAASSVAERATGTVEMAASQGMSKAAATLGEVAQAVRQSGEQLREQQPQVAGIVDTAAEQLERASSYLREGDLQDVVHRVEDIARRQPAIFIGGAFVLGLAAARFLKSSAGASANKNQGGQGWSTGPSFRDVGYGAGATGYGSTGGYVSRTTEIAGDDEFARSGGYGSRR